MVDNKKALGSHGETAAASFLMAQGCTLLETNYKIKSAEIDIIAKDLDVICFIEVKTRRTLKKGFPREAVNAAKQQKILHGATHYLKKNRQMNSPVRLDVIEVLETPMGFDINWIKNAFGAQ